MESSFFDDLLKKDVDQNAVNALVGTLESHVTSATNPSSKLATPVPFSSSSLANDGSKNSQSGLNMRGSSATTISGTIYSNVSASTSSINGSMASAPLPNSISSSSNNNGNKQFSNTRSPTPNRQVISTPLVGSSSSTQQAQLSNIAPKNIIASAVPIAPRMPTTIMITPQQAQALMAQRFGSGTTIVPSSILGNVRMSGAQVPLAPRLTGPNNLTSMSMNMMSGQIPGIQSISSRLTLAQNQLITSQNQSPPVGVVQTIKQEPNASSNSPKPSSMTMQSISNPLQSNAIVMPSASLTQVKGTSPIPGVVTYRFRQVTPTTNANTNNVTVMKESVKKLKEFFQNLISLASGPNQPPDIGNNVKELVQNVMYNKMNEEEFVEKLQLTLKSDPQPNLVPFLKKTLPHLRETMKQKTKVQTPQPQQLINKLQSQQVKPRGTTVSQPINKLQPTTISGQKLMANAIPGTMLQMTNNNAKRLTPTQQMMLNRTIAIQQRQMMLKQMTQGDRLVNPAAGGKDISSAVLKTNLATSVQAQVAAANADKNKQKTAFHYSSAMTSNDDDINDVTCMAGVNLMEESANILSTGSELLGSQTRSCKDETFLSTEPLKRKIETIAKKHCLREVQQDVMSIVSHAAEERLRNILERMAVLSLHRVEAHKNHPDFEVVSDVKSQLKVFEQIDEVERKHREAREREMLMRVAKSRSRTEDPEQARLKEKAKQLQQEEEELLRKRAANKTALEAIGPRKKRKLDEALASLGSSKSQDQGSTAADGSSSSQPVRLRTRRLTLKDLQFVMEQEKESAKSQLLFKSFLR